MSSTLVMLMLAGAWGAYDSSAGVPTDSRFGATAVVMLPDAASPSPSARAGQTATFGVQPASKGKPDARPQLNYGATAGSSLDDQVALINLSLIPLKLRVYATDSAPSRDGNFTLLPGNIKPTDVGAWVRFRMPSDGQITVPARSHVIVPIRVAVPPDAAPGDHTGGVIVALNTAAKNAKGDNITLEQRVATRLLVRVSGALVPRLDIENLEASYAATNSSVGKGEVRLSYVVHNVGNIRLGARETATVKGLFGPAVRAQDLPAVPELAPKSSFKVTTTITGVLPLGKLTTKVTVVPTPKKGDADPRLVPTQKATVLWAIPWLLLIGLAVLVALAVLNEARRRRRRRRSADSAPTSASSVRQEALT